MSLVVGPSRGPAGCGVADPQESKTTDSLGKSCCLLDRPGWLLGPPSGLWPFSVIRESEGDISGFQMPCGKGLQTGPRA